MKKILSARRKLVALVIYKLCTHLCQEEESMYVRGEMHVSVSCACNIKDKANNSRLT